MVTVTRGRLSSLSHLNIEAIHGKASISGAEGAVGDLRGEKAGMDGGQGHAAMRVKNHHSRMTRDYVVDGKSVDRHRSKASPGTDDPESPERRKDLYRVELQPPGLWAGVVESSIPTSSWESPT
jgi:uncharacterized lipoprotein YddW (UPF0748 family)